jgi:hypothetical protein
MSGMCSTQERRNVYKILIEEPQGKRPLGGARHGGRNNMKINLKRINYEGMD